MADDNKIEVLISAQADALKTGLDEAKAAVAGATNEMRDSLGQMSGAGTQAAQGFSGMASQVKSQLQGLSAQVQAVTSGIAGSLKSITAPLSGIAGAVAAVAGIFAGLTGVFTAAVKEQDDWVRDSLQIARVTGQSAEDASVMKLAMEELAAQYVTTGVSTETLTRAYQMFVNKYAEGSDEVKKYAADWQGTMFATFLATIEKYQQLDSATDQAMARSALFGTRLGATLIPVLNTLSKEGLEKARQKARELGLVVGDDAVKASQSLAQSTLHLHEEWQALSAHLSTGAMPAWNAIKEVMAGALGIANSIAKAIGEVTGALSRLGAEAEGRQAKLGAGLHGTILTGYGSEGGAEELPVMPKKDQPGPAPQKAGAGGAAGGAGGAGGSIVSDWQAQLDQLKAEDAAWQDQSLAMTKAFWAQHLASGKTATKEEEDSLKAAIEASLRAREEKEKEYWTARLAQCAAGSKDYQEVEHKIVALEAQINKERLQGEISLIKGKIAANQASLKDQEAALTQQMRLDDAALRMKEEGLKHQVKMGEMSDAEELQQYRTLLAQKLAADLNNEKAIAALYKGDETAYREHLNRIAVLAQENQLKLKQIDDKIEQDSQSDWSKLETMVGSQFRRIVGSLTSGGKDINNVLSGVFKDIANDFAEMIEQMIAQWNVLQSIMSSISGLFGGGGGGGFSIGGALAGVMGFERGGIVPSAAGGWEVPAAGLALLHPREMVLPADLAGGIRNLVAGGAAGGEGGGDVHNHFHVNAMDSGDVSRFFKKHGPSIMNSIQRSLRVGLRTK